MCESIGRLTQQLMQEHRPGEDNQALFSRATVEKHGWQGMWKPITDTVPLKEAEVEVQLVEKKNKLFGKVESDWK